MEPSSQVVKAVVKIQNRVGMHARPAMAFVDIANNFSSQVQVRKGGQVVDGKSIMQMLTLAAEFGSELTIEATGSDAAAVVSALKELIDRKFDEP